MSDLIEATKRLLDRCAAPSFTIINEELKDNEKRDAEQMKHSAHALNMENFIKTHAAPGTWDEFQDDKDTARKVIRIPVKLNQDDAEPSYPVRSFLEEKGYHIKNTESYRKGLAHREITTGDPERGIPLRTKFQAVKIGSILEQHRAPDHVLHAYQHDPVRVGAGTSDFDLVISHHPHDVYGMSTGRGWTSCAQMRKGEGSGGIAAQHMSDEINNHTHVAYLVKRGGNYDTEAMGRLAFKHHTALNETVQDGYQKHQTLVSEGKVYGSTPTDFRAVAENEMAKRFPIRNDIYVKNSAVYNDNASAIHIQKSISLQPDALDAAWKNVDKKNKYELYRHVGLDGKYKSKKLRDVQTALKSITAAPTGDFIADFDRIRYSTSGLDSDQVLNGIGRNQAIPHEHIHNHVGKIMQQFDPTNEDQVQTVHSFLRGYGNSSHPLRHAITRGLHRAIPVVRTARDFAYANRIHKLLGNREHDKITIAHDHQLGHDPIRTLGMEGYLRDAEDYMKAYHSLRDHDHANRNDNYYGVVHKLAMDNVPRAHKALDAAIERLRSNTLSRNIGTAYSRMNPAAQRFYAQELGHNLDDMLRTGKEAEDLV